MLPIGRFTPAVQFNHTHCSRLSVLKALSYNLSSLKQIRWELCEMDQREFRLEIPAIQLPAKFSVYSECNRCVMMQNTIFFTRCGARIHQN